MSPRRPRPSDIERALERAYEAQAQIERKERSLWARTEDVARGLAAVMESLQHLYRSGIGLHAFAGDGSTCLATAYLEERGTRYRYRYAVLWDWQTRWDLLAQRPMSARPSTGEVVCVDIYYRHAIAFAFRSHRGVVPRFNTVWPSGGFGEGFVKKRYITSLVAGGFMAAARNESETMHLNPQHRVMPLGALALTGVALAVAMVAAGAPVAAQDEPMSAADGMEIGNASVLSGANGVYVGPDGNVYTASVAGSEIIVQDPESGDIVDRIGAERGVAGPDDIFITEDGTIYWTEILGGNVGMLKPDGTFTTQQVAPGVNPITMSDDGRLFVARVFLGDGLYELDPELVEEPQVVIPDIVSLNGFDFGPDGMLYGPLQFGGGVVRIDVDAETPQAEMVVEGLRTPTAVKFDSQGRLHAVDLAEGQIVRVDLESGEREIVLDIEGTLDNMTFDPADRIFTAASSDGQILRVDTDGTVQPLNEAGFTSPAGVAITSDGNTWVVADAFSVWGFGPDGERVATLYDRFSPPGTEFTGAFTLSADGDQLISSSWFGNSVQVFDPATGEIIEDVRTLAAPLNAIRHGEALVASQGGLPDGNNVVDVNTGEELIGGLALPVGLASDGETLFVSDWAMGTISTVSANGEVGVLTEGLVNPEGMIVDGDRLLVVEEGLGRVAAVDLSSGAVTPVIEGLELPGPVVPGTFPHGALSSVAVGADGSIVVTSNGDKTVRVFPASEG